MAQLQMGKKPKTKPKPGNAEPDPLPHIQQAEINMQTVQNTIEGQSSKVTNSANAINFLIKKGHIAGAADCTLVNLAFILLSISITPATSSST
jgi:hypothetical protein